MLIVLAPHLLQSGGTEAWRGPSKYGITTRLCLALLYGLIVTGIIRVEGRKRHLPVAPFLGTTRVLFTPAVPAPLAVMPAPARREALEPTYAFILKIIID